MLGRWRPALALSSLAIGCADDPSPAEPIDRCLTLAEIVALRRQGGAVTPEAACADIQPLLSPVPDCPSIAEFGALPDDGQVDTSAIQEALENAAGCAFIPRGVFDVSRPLRMRLPGFVLRGQGAEGVLRFDNSLDFRATYPGRTGILNVHADDVTIQEIAIDQNFRGSGRVDGDPPIVSSIAVGEVDFGLYENLTVRSSVFHDYYGDAVQGRDVYVHNARISDNLFRSAFVVGGWSAAGVGGEQAVSFDLGSGITVVDNQIEGALDDAIAFHIDVADVVVADNTITTTGGRIIMNGTSNSVVTRNIITYIQAGATAISVSREPVTRLPTRNLATISRNLLISNNTIMVRSGVSAPGGLIYVHAGEGIRVSGNVLSRADRAGFGIRVTDRELEGILYGNVGVELTDNRITGAATGIGIYGDRSASRDILIRNNVVSRCDVGVIDRLGPTHVTQVGNSLECDTPTIPAAPRDGR